MYQFSQREIKYCFEIVEGEEEKQNNKLEMNKPKNVREKKLVCVDRKKQHEKQHENVNERERRDGKT